MSLTLQRPALRLGSAPRPLLRPRAPASACGAWTPRERERGRHTRRRAAAAHTTANGDKECGGAGIWPTRPPTEPMQGVQGSGHLAHTTANGANARSAGGWASASTSARGADARSAGRRASASTSASGAHARSAGARASASTSASGADARSAGWTDDLMPEGLEELEESGHVDHEEGHRGR